MAGTTLPNQADIPWTAGQSGEYGLYRSLLRRAATVDTNVRTADASDVSDASCLRRQQVVWLLALASNTLWSKNARRKRVSQQPLLRELVL